LARALPDLRSAEHFLAISPPNASMAEAQTSAPPTGSRLAWTTDASVSRSSALVSFAKAADDEMRSERGRQATNVGSVRKRPKNFRQGAVKLSESVVSNGCGLASVCRESAAERKGGDVADARRDCHVTYKGSGAGKLLLSVGTGQAPSGSLCAARRLAADSVWRSADRSRGRRGRCGRRHARQAIG
jgi:hypothetical protein